MAISNNNVQNVRFLRNGTLFTTRDVAKDALTGFQLTADMDGTMILARYQEGTDPIKTIIGYVYYKDNEHKSITIVDIDDVGTDVKEELDRIDATIGSGATSAYTVTEQLQDLSGSTASTSAETSVEGAKRYADGLKDAMDYTGVTTGTGIYVSNVTQTDGIISASTRVLPSTNSVSGENTVIIDVTETEGQITATAANITGVKLAGYAEGTDADIAATDTLGQALGKLQAQINAMDKSADVVDGQVVTTVTEVDGKVSETKANVKDLQLGGYVKSSSTGAIASADTINEALSKLENKAAAITITNADGSINVTTGASGTDINVNIKTGEHVIAKDGNNGLYTNISLSSITPSSTTVKEEYQLTATDGTKLGETIKIYKDSSIVEIYLGTSGDSVDATTGEITKLDGDKQYLNYVYFKADGTYEMTKINISVFITEQEFASGVTFDSTENKVKGVVDPDSEKNSGGTAFLTVDAAGFKVNGIKQEIIDRINELDAVVTGGTTAGTATSNHVQVIVGEVDGKLTGVTVTETNVADKDKLETLSGKTVTAVEMTGGTAAISAHTDGTKKITINTDGSQIKMTNYTKGSDSGAVASTDSINAAISKIENRIDGEIDALDADVSGNSIHVTVGVQELNGKITGVTVSESNVANADDLAAEIAARKAVDGQTGQTYAKNTSSTFISGATDLNDADVKLDAALKALSDRTVDEVKVNGKTLAETNNGVDIHISSIAGTDAASTPIVINTANNGDVTIKLEGLDCGTY